MVAPDWLWGGVGRARPRRRAPARDLVRRRANAGWPAARPGSSPPSADPRPAPPGYPLAHPAYPVVPRAKDKKGYNDKNMKYFYHYIFFPAKRPEEGDLPCRS